MDAMAVPLRRALRETLRKAGRTDVDPLSVAQCGATMSCWRSTMMDGATRPRALGADLSGPSGPGPFPGAPARRAHAARVRPASRLRPMFAAWSSGQDPYPCPAFATGRGIRGRQRRAAGGSSTRCSPPACARSSSSFVAARTGDGRFARRSRARWPATSGGHRGGLRGRAGSARRPRGPVGRVGRAAPQHGADALAVPARRAIRTRVRGHLPLWRPLMRAGARASRGAETRRSSSSASATRRPRRPRGGWPGRAGCRRRIRGL